MGTARPLCELSDNGFMSSGHYSTAPALLRSIGVLILLYAFLIAMAAFFAPKDGLFGLRFSTFQVVERFVAFMVTMTLVGVGLLLLQKWAAIALSFAGIYGAFACVNESVRGLTHPVPGNWEWVGLVFAAIFIVPIVLTVYSWRHLVWWKRLPTTAIRQ